MAALWRAYDHFWANDPGPGGVGLQDRYAAAWRHVAKRFRSKPWLLGYDLFNEPWPGSVWTTCANPVGCPLFDGGPLTSFSKKMISSVREVNGRKLIWYEPNVIFNSGADTHHGDTGDDSTGMSFHIYCLPEAFSIPGLPPEACDALERLVLTNAEEQTDRTGDALLISEFGATDNLETIGRIVEASDDSMVSWQYWHYCACDDPTTSGPGVQAVVIDAHQPPTGSNVKEAKLDVLARAYPRTVAGTPQNYDFNEETRRFELSLSTTGPGGQSFVPTDVKPKKKKKGKRKRKKGRKGTASAFPTSFVTVPASTPQTEVFLPERHYPKGYEVDVDGGGIASAPGARLLRIAACPDRKRVSVIVRRPGQGVVDGPDCLVAGAKRTRLRMRVRPRVAPVGERTCFAARVRTRERTRVKGAQVRLGNQVDRTDRRGKAKLCQGFAAPGKYRITARKLG
jgi:endoglycosylceramidase